jgi:hypothetical protein
MLMIYSCKSFKNLHADKMIVKEIRSEQHEVIYPRQVFIFYKNFEPCVLHKVTRSNLPSTVEKVASNASG